MKLIKEITFDQLSYQIFLFKHDLLITLGTCYGETSTTNGVSMIPQRKSEHGNRCDISKFVLYTQHNCHISSCLKNIYEKDITNTKKSSPCYKGAWHQLCRIQNSFLEPKSDMAHHYSIKLLDIHQQSNILQEIVYKSIFLNHLLLLVIS